MRQLAWLMLCATFLSPSGGCGVYGTPEVAEESTALREIAAQELPQGLDLCTDLYGAVANWPAVDAIYGVRGEPDAMILEVQGQLTCHAPRWEAAVRADLARLVKLIPNLAFGQDVPLIEELPPTNGTISNASAGERDDSNPLPASPIPDESADDSNPLPARGGRWPGQADSVGSNPLPATPTQQDTLNADLAERPDTPR